MKKYFWQDLPQEIREDWWQEMTQNDNSFSEEQEERIDDYINRNNFARTLGEWENFIEDIKTKKADL